MYLKCIENMTDFLGCIPWSSFHMYFQFQNFISLKKIYEDAYSVFNIPNANQARMCLHFH